jgi:hypothetical protein
MVYRPSFHPELDATPGDDAPPATLGIFGRVNTGTRLGELRDGHANTVMTGELQRITTMQPTSKDGWTIGGPASLFTAGAMFSFSGVTLANVDSTADGSLMNNGFLGFARQRPRQRRELRLGRRFRKFHGRRRSQSFRPDWQHERPLSRRAGIAFLGQNRGNATIFVIFWKVRV